MGGGEIEWAELADQFHKDTSYQESLLMEHEVLNTIRGHVRNDVSLHAKALGYIILKEVTPPPGMILMKRARRGQPPATQLSREIIEVGEEEEIGVSEPVCGGTAVDVVSSPEDTTDDRTILVELGYTGKRKEPVSATKPQTIPKGAKKIVIGEKTEGNEANRGQEKEGTKRHCLDLILSEVPGKKRGPSESASLKPPNKKVKSVEEEGFAAGGEHYWQRSVEPPYSTNFVGIFGDEGTRMAVRTKGDDRRLTVVTMPTANKNCVYRGEVGLALGSGLVSKDLEEKLEKTSTLDLYLGFANRIATVGILSQTLSSVYSSELTCFCCRSSLACRWL
ncbi:hypothetical protein AXF42_Ash007212 [Apostasia shenzhenica]|uniref:Uncharacterized protein n=1 Tax=Apostasia shenzhenica TaxID=1088818 RepID=A0A2I0B9K4_9ASPA|nr:hypothetical protein AXF42_Ash007212 [Apostasia shenzhenica]